MNTSRLRVTDRGIGIPAEELKSIFKRFYRVPGRNSFTDERNRPRTLHRPRGGASHGGKVYAASDGEGLGTTFTLELPRKIA